MSGIQLTITPFTQNDATGMFKSSALTFGVNTALSVLYCPPASTFSINTEVCVWVYLMLFYSMGLLDADHFLLCLICLLCLLDADEDNKLDSIQSQSPFPQNLTLITIF